MCEKLAKRRPVVWKNFSLSFMQSGKTCAKVACLPALTFVMPMRNRLSVDTVSEFPMPLLIVRS